MTCSVFSQPVQFTPRHVTFFIFLKSNPRFSCFSFATRKNNWIMKWIFMSLSSLCPDDDTNWIMKWESMFMIDELRRMQKYLYTWNLNHDFTNCFPICRVDESPLWVEPNFEKRTNMSYNSISFYHEDPSSNILFKIHWMRHFILYDTSCFFLFLN